MPWNITAITLDILAETGFDYVGDWVNDEQPYELTLKSGRLLSVPYSIEVNDIPAFIDRGWSAEQFYQTIVDQFDVLYEDGEANGRIMAIALHPFLIGHGFRSKYLDKAFAYITGHDKVWRATGSQIADWYRGENETADDHVARIKSEAEAADPLGEKL